MREDVEQLLGYWLNFYHIKHSIYIVTINGRSLQYKQLPYYDMYAALIKKEVASLVAILSELSFNSHFSFRFTSQSTNY